MELRRWREKPLAASREKILLLPLDIPKNLTGAPQVSNQKPGKTGSRVGQQTFLKMVLTHNRNDSDITARI
jgi:hypothetical protein